MGIQTRTNAIDPEHDSGAQSAFWTCRCCEVVAAYADNTLSQNIASKTQSECGMARGSCGMMRYMRCGRVAPAVASRVEKCYDFGGSLGIPSTGGACRCIGNRVAAASEL